MQKLKIILYAVLFFSAGSFASSTSDYGNFMVYAQIMSQNCVFEVRSLSFGTILVTKDKQIIKVLPIENNTQGESGKFIIMGRKNQNFLAMLKKQNINMNYGDNYLKVKDFTLSMNGKKPEKILKGILDNEEAEIFVGATLEIPKDQKTGNYSGKNTIVVYMY